MDESNLASPTVPSSSAPSLLDIEVDVEETLQVLPAVMESSPVPSPEHLPAPHHQLGGGHMPICRRMLILFGVLAAIVVAVSFLTIHLWPKGTNIHECKMSFSVSKLGTKSDFQTISQAIEASPNNFPFKVCLYIGAGEYQEMVEIGYDKTNLILIGEGINKTTIISNASTTFQGNLIATTLRVIGNYFMAQDLTIINTARNGVAVDNWSSKSVFSKCNIRGANRTISVRGSPQFYRDCNLYGETEIVTSNGYSFFQRCKLFISERAQEEKEIVFSRQYSYGLGDRKIALIFHLCSFSTAKTMSEKVSIVGPSEDVAFTVVMQSFLDASITNYLSDSFLSNATYFWIYGNYGPDVDTIPMRSSVHVLTTEMAKSKFSLRAFLSGDTAWILPEVDYDLDLAE